MIKLTYIDGASFLLNPDYIIMVSESQVGDKRVTGLIVGFNADGSAIVQTVQESMGQVGEMITNGS